MAVLCCSPILHSIDSFIYLYFYPEGKLDRDIHMYICNRCSNAIRPSLFTSYSQNCHLAVVDTYYCVYRIIMKM